MSTTPPADVVALGPLSIDEALDLAARPDVADQRLSALARTWVGPATFAPDTFRLAVARELINHQPHRAEVMGLVALGCIDIVTHHQLRCDEASYQAALTALRAQTAGREINAADAHARIRSRQAHCDNLAEAVSAGDVEREGELKALVLELDAMRELAAEAERRARPLLGATATRPSRRDLRSRTEHAVALAA